MAVTAYGLKINQYITTSLRRLSIIDCLTHAQRSLRSMIVSEWSAIGSLSSFRCDNNEQQFVLTVRWF